jgi:hypothetical protein
MRLQVFAILENGVSKILPRQADTLRVLLILPDRVEARPSDRPERGPIPAVAEGRRRVMASLAGGST